MIQFKEGVSLSGLTPQMAAGLSVVASVFAARMATCTVTSGNDSTHSNNSLHYTGEALDFRTKDYRGDKTSLVDAVKRALGGEFDVVFEGKDTDNEHLHVEYQPE